MSYYSLVASFPALRIGDEPPFSVESFVQQCAQWVTPRELQTLKKVLLAAPDIQPCPYSVRLYDMETQLRNSVARFRAQRLGVDVSAYLKPHDGFSGEIEALVGDAVGQADPLEQEQDLDRARWKLVDGLVDLGNPFGFGRVLAYGIQLKIVERWNGMDPHTGKQKLESVIEVNTRKEHAAEDATS